jgi:hypothetical protein
METLERFASLVCRERERERERERVETNCRRNQKEIPSGNPARLSHGRRNFLTYWKKNH